VGLNLGPRLIAGEIGRGPGTLHTPLFGPPRRGWRNAWRRAAKPGTILCSEFDVARLVEDHRKTQARPEYFDVKGARTETGTWPTECFR